MNPTFIKSSLVVVQKLSYSSFFLSILTNYSPKELFALCILCIENKQKKRQQRYLAAIDSSIIAWFQCNSTFNIGSPASSEQIPPDHLYTSLVMLCCIPTHVLYNCISSNGIYQLQNNSQCHVPQSYSSETVPH